MKKIKPHFEESTMWALIRIADREIRTGKLPPFLKDHIKTWKRIRYMKSLKKALPTFYKLYKVFNAQMELIKFSKDLFPADGKKRLAVGKLPVIIHEGNIDLSQAPAPYKIPR